MTDYEGYLRDEGDEYADVGPRRSSGGHQLPEEKELKALKNAILTELIDAETQRVDFVQMVEQAWRDYGMNPYRSEELPMADMVVNRVPITKARVDQMHSSMFATLNTDPFATAEVDGGQAGDTAHHASLALSQELRDMEFPNTLSTMLLATGVTGTGVLKDGVVGDHLDPDTISIQDLILSPHAPRTLEQCTMVAHRFYEPLRWVRDQAIAGLFHRESVRKLSGSTAWGANDGGAVERETLNLSDDSGWMSRETSRVEMLEVYIRVRPKITEASEMWRVTCARQGSQDITVLRAELWSDGFPFTLVRIHRNGNVVYGQGFPNTLKDIQYSADMISSAAMEADFMSTAPLWEVDEMSPAGKMLKARMQQRGGAVRPRPGEIFWRKGTGEAVRAIHINPSPPAIDARLNRLESYANVATIPVVPMQTYRSATEHRFAQANVSAKENMMLQTLRADLSRYIKRCAMLYRKYIAEPHSAGTFMVQHGSVQFGPVQDEHWNALRWSPRGMTSQADQMLQMQATQETMMISDDYWGKLPAAMQMGEQAVMALWESRRMRLEALGVQEWQKIIGDSPKRDPRVTEMGPDAMVAGQTLLGTAQGGQQQQMGQMGPDMRQSDGAQTSVPGMEGIN
jgi:hypothetical protein